MEVGKEAGVLRGGEGGDGAGAGGEGVDVESVSLVC